MMNVNLNKHSQLNLDEFNSQDSINLIKKILNNLITPINEDEKIIKDINEYIDEYIINNDFKNFVDKDFSLVNTIDKNEDILLIY